MKVGTQTKLCFVPIGATVEIAGVDWILMSKSDDFEIGLMPTSSAGWHGHTNVLEKLFFEIGFVIERQRRQQNNVLEGHDRQTSDQN